MTFRVRRNGCRLVADAPPRATPEQGRKTHPHYPERGEGQGPGQQTQPGPSPDPVARGVPVVVDVQADAAGDGSDNSRENDNTREDAHAQGVYRIPVHTDGEVAARCPALDRVAAGAQRHGRHSGRIQGAVRHTARAAAMQTRAPSAVLATLNEALLRDDNQRFGTAVYLRLCLEADAGGEAAAARTLSRVSPVPTG